MKVLLTLFLFDLSGKTRFSRKSFWKQNYLYPHFNSNHGKEKNKAGCKAKIKNLVRRVRVHRNVRGGLCGVLDAGVHSGNHSSGRIARHGCGDFQHARKRSFRHTKKRSFLRIRKNEERDFLIGASGFLIAVLALSFFIGYVSLLSAFMTYLAVGFGVAALITALYMIIRLGYDE